MFIPRIYYPHNIENGETFSLEKDTAHYLLTVLRLKNEEQIVLFNGEGGEYTAKVLVEKKRVHVHILNFKNMNTEPLLDIHLGQGLLRGDRMDFVIQKATELGVNSITPLFSKNSNVKLDEARSQKRWQHWHNIAVSAAEQSGRVKIPTIHPPQELTQWAQSAFEGSSIVFSPSSNHSLKNISVNGAVRFGIGPESGWDPNEVKMMISHHFIAATLGPRILRAETASISALTLLQGFYGDLCEGAFSK
ncbi:MAG: 16S rRNA (uracil(1498)-N(3))-methyltransferase [Candidatus Berkiella sp.]